MLNFENLLHPPATKGRGVSLSKEYLELDTWKNNKYYNSFFYQKRKGPFFVTIHSVVHLYRNHWIYIFSFFPLLPVSGEHVKGVLRCLGVFYCINQNGCEAGGGAAKSRGWC